jgi:hypothetical protein
MGGNGFQSIQVFLAGYLGTQPTLRSSDQIVHRDHANHSTLVIDHWEPPNASVLE